MIETSTPIHASGKVAYLVLGPESSGTRLLTRILISCGCEGDPDHFQRFDKSLDGAGSKIVWRRSVPHDKEWDEAAKLLVRCRQAGYEVRVLAVTRSFYCTANSQVKEGHATTLKEAREHIVRAISLITDFVAKNKLPVLYVTYEEIVNHIESLSRSLAEWGLTCDMLKLERIYDQNQQYLTGNAKAVPVPTFGTPRIVKLTPKHVPADNKTWIRAFIKTNGTSRHIFTSLSEHDRNGWPRAVYCAPRTVGNDRGILLCVAFDNEDSSPNWSIQVVVSQRDATEYCEPVLFTGR